jgi:hypothetical protein
MFYTYPGSLDRPMTLFVVMLLKESNIVHLPTAVAKLVEQSTNYNEFDGSNLGNAGTG